MSQKRKISKAERQRRKQHRADQRFEEMLRDTAAVFISAMEISHDYAHQCDDSRENLEADIAFNALALQIWQGRPGRAEELSRVLADLLAERKRHFAALGEFMQRFRELADDDSFRDYLVSDGIDADFVRRKVFPEPETEPEPSPAA